MISARSGTTRVAQAFCKSMIFLNIGSFDSRSMIVSQAFSWASSIDLGVRTTLTPLDLISIRSLLLASKKYFQVASADWAIEAYLKIAWRSAGIASYFF